MDTKKLQFRLSPKLMIEVDKDFFMTPIDKLDNKQLILFNLDGEQFDFSVRKGSTDPILLLKLLLWCKQPDGSGNEATSYDAIIQYVLDLHKSGDTISYSEAQKLKESDTEDDTRSAEPLPSLSTMRDADEASVAKSSRTQYEIVRDRAQSAVGFLRKKLVECDSDLTNVHHATLSPDGSISSEALLGDLLISPGGKNNYALNLPTYQSLLVYKHHQHNLRFDPEQTREFHETYIMPSRMEDLNGKKVDNPLAMKADDRLISIIAPSGMGKSMLLQAITLACSFRTGNYDSMMPFYRHEVAYSEEPASASDCASEPEYQTKWTSGASDAPAPLAEIVPKSVFQAECRETKSKSVKKRASRKKRSASLVHPYPHMGKELADKFGFNCDRFPVLILAKNYTRTISQKETFSLFSLAECHEHFQFHSLVEEGLRNNKLLLLIDAIDEIDADLRQSFINKINNWMTENPSAKVIVTCRYPLGLPNERTLTLAGFGPKEMEILAKQLQPGKADKLTAAVVGNRHLTHLCSNPNFCTAIFCLNNGELRLNNCLEQIIDKTIAYRLPHIGYDTNVVKLTLGWLAWNGIVNRLFSSEMTDGKKSILCISRSNKVNIVKDMTDALKQVQKLAPSQFPGTPDDANNKIKRLASAIPHASGLLHQTAVDYRFQDQLIAACLAASFLEHTMCASQYATINPDADPYATSDANTLRTLYLENTMLQATFSPAINASRIEAYITHTISLPARQQFGDFSTVLTEELCQTLVIMTARGLAPTIVDGLFLFMLMRGVTTNEFSEAHAIATTLAELLLGVYGSTQILNSIKDSEPYTSLLRFFLNKVNEHTLDPVIKKGLDELAAPAQSNNPAENKAKEDTADE